jgi:hypothetical protein
VFAGLLAELDDGHRQARHFYFHPDNVIITPKGLGQTYGDGMQGQAHARSYDGAVDADVLQIAS